MAPEWKPEEMHSGVYQEVEKHSDGMITFTYRPPSRQDVEVLKDTETYRGLMNEPGKTGSVGRLSGEKKTA